MSTRDKQAQEYLTKFRAALKGIPAVEREEWVNEIRAHIRDSVEQGLPVEQVLAQLGAAHELAAQYREALWVKRASRTRSPWSMLQSLFWLAQTSALGCVCFCVAVAGYAGGASMILTALLKPFFPHQVGLWVGPGVFNFGFHADGQYGGGVGFILATGRPAHEVLGWWYIPVALTIGALFLWCTMVVLRRLVRRMKSGKHPDIVFA